MFFMGGYNSTGGIQLSFLWVYNSLEEFRYPSWGFVIPLEGFSYPSKGFIITLEGFRYPSLGVIIPLEGFS